jgi:7-cyano-7-deazaguanine synthase
MSEVYHNHWSTTGKAIPGAHSPDEAVYLPGRNLILLSLAASYAAVSGASAIEIGILKTNPFADSTPEFLNSLTSAVRKGLAKKIEINAPFRKFLKPQVILRGKGLSLELTFSCIDPKGKKHCGRCNKCVERKMAFLEAGIADKTIYLFKGIPR